MGIGIALGIVMVILKLTHHIDWPWLLILLPFIIDFIFGVIAFFCGIKLFGSHFKQMDKMNKDMERRGRNREW